jgi:Zn-dependent peptidase ImmA (M78 family)
MLYNIDVFDMEQNILGAIDMLNEVIYTNENARLIEKQGVYEFTLAHEVGHLDLHGGCKEQLVIADKTFSLICRNGDKDFREYQANKYASSLLMPKFLIDQTLENKRIRDWPVLYEIADICRVSISALKIRLENLGKFYFDEKSRKFYESRKQAMGQQNLF